MDQVQLAGAIVVGFAALGVVVAVVFARRQRVRKINVARVSGDPTEVLDELQLAISGTSRTTVRRDSDRVLTLESRWTAWWAVVVAVLAFPLGLVALLFTERESATVIVDPTSDGMVVMRLAGSFRGEAVDAVNRVIERRSVATTSVPVPT